MMKLCNINDEMNDRWVQIRRFLDNKRNENISPSDNWNHQLSYDWWNYIDDDSVDIDEFEYHRLSPQDLLKMIQDEYKRTDGYRMLTCATVSVADDNSNTHQPQKPKLKKMEGIVEWADLVNQEYILSPYLPLDCFLSWL